MRALRRAARGPEGPELGTHGGARSDRRSGRQRDIVFPRQGPRMQPEPTKGTARRVPRERAGKGAQGAGARVGCAKAEPPTPGWALTLEGLAAMRPAQRHSHLLFGDLLEDVGAAASVFPSESAELGYRMPDPRAWTLPLEPPAQRQDRVLGVLKAAEARGRVRTLRLRYARLRVRQGRGRGEVGTGGLPGPGLCGRGGAARR